MNRKGMRVMGHLLILLGILLPLYGFGSLSKGILLEKANYRRYMASDRSSYEKVAPVIEKYNAELGGQVAAVDPFATDDYAAAESFIDDPDGVFAFLRIPKLDLYQPIYMDASKENLARGVAHIMGTDLPGQSPGLRAVIAGHRGYYQSTFFIYLNELAEGDPVYVEWKDNVLEYKVVGQEVIQPWEVEKLNPVEGKTMLTLLTCNPMRPPRRQRLLVNCELVKKDEGNAAAASSAGTSAGEGKKTPVSKKVKQMNAAVLAITVVLVVLLLWRGKKFVDEFRKKEDEARE
ncbi:class C sortase [Aedoeadaptatus urinae]|uniref:class C sortase n=1 Tax=Aedoeadaptatus urinae TaxID=1871017 RepID=UPI00097DE6BC|nr:class C sortase [Peptoniphilus urinae]